MTAPSDRIDPLCLWKPVLMFSGTGNTHASMMPSPEGYYVTVEDHTAAIAAAEARGLRMALNASALCLDNGKTKNDIYAAILAMIHEATNEST